MQRIAIPILMSAWMLLGASSAHAQEPQPPNLATPPRLSLADGQVSFWRPGGQDWAPAHANTPLAAGDSIYTGPGANAEIQVGDRAYVRIGESTQLQLSSIEPDFVQFKVTAGEASLDLRQLAPGHTFEVDTPNAAYTIEHLGYYRVNVNEQSAALITRRGGSAMLTPSNGSAMRVNASEEVLASGTDTPRVESYAAPELDSWDRWNYNRTDHLMDSMSVRYVSPEVYGAADLDHSGTWRTVPEYGAVWVPDGVAPGWAPYSAGHWISDPVYGWTWVDDAPWGWAPYHYGRWVYVSGYWAWAPGPAVAHPMYAPALVAWLGGVHVTVGVGVGWVALGWGEPVVPWWGPREYAGVPSWRGWGGPRVVNRTVVNTTTVNVTNINVQNITYANTQVHNAVIATSTEHFAHGGREFIHASPEQLHEVRPAEHGMDIRPTAASLTPEAGHTARPPQEFVERKVVARRVTSTPNSWPRDERRDMPEPAAHVQDSEHGRPVPTASPAQARLEERGRSEPSDRHNGTEQEQLRPTPPALSEHHADVQTAMPSSASAANHPAPTERMKPPPPPSFNEWRNQQQGQKEQGGHEPSAVHNAGSPPPVSSPAGQSAQPAQHANPEQHNGGHPNLPGEPAMKLRPAKVASGTNHNPAGRASCKEHDCR
ncbi:MAG TPA: DUF6600 domain-containing protein [Burkholderiales bacterium]|nr:DUF6600 domain-containing protein [Burkholderiales bacterium]